MSNQHQQLKLISWNINGIRAGIKKGLWDKLKTIELKADIYGFQEVKCDGVVIEQEMTKLNQGTNLGIADGDLFIDKNAQPGFEKYDYVYHTATNRAGYSGVMLMIGDKVSKTGELEKIVGINNPEFDIEGRMVGIKFNYGKQKLALLNGYYPQGGRGPHRVQYKIQFYHHVLEIAKALEKEGYGVILCGDMNTTVADIDLARPNQNRQTTGCLPEEREALGQFFSAGYIDTFRYFYPDTPNKYTYWDQITRARERNVGWRIDYFLISSGLLPYLQSAQILDQIMGSDHCPVGIILDFSLV